MAKTRKRQVRRPASVKSSKTEKQQTGSWHRRHIGRLAAAGGAALLTAVIGVVVAKTGDRTVEEIGKPSLPISINLVSDPADIPAFNDTGEYVLVPAHPGRTAAPPDGDPCSAEGGLRRWARPLGDIDSRQSRVRLALQGHSAKPVLVTGVYAHVLTRRPIQNLIELECLPAGQASPRDMLLDLDTGRPMARDVEGGKPVPFHGYTLNSGEQEQFDITAKTERPEVIEWYLRISLLVDGKVRNVDVQDHGQPLRTTAFPVPEVHRYAWDGQSQGGNWFDVKDSQVVANPFG